MASELDLDFWIKNGLNVMFRGKHGTGKTSQVLEAFKKNNLKFQYFSASTMDPWVDFVGVPKEKTDENGVSYLDLIRPKHFQNDEVEAIFFDEFNRANKKILNSVMELIQFKSINGKKFNNLKIIWAAINPEDDEQEHYSVEELDPAQLDRFHVIVDVPYIPNADYFRSIYGNDMADSAITWWKELKAEEKNLVSPRRLDYALDIFKKGGDIKHVLNKQVNTNKLLIELETGSISKKLKEFWENKKEQEAKDFLSVENYYSACSNYIIKNKSYHEFFLPLLPEEKLVALMNSDRGVENYVFDTYDKFEDIIKNIANSDTGKLSNPAKKIVERNAKIRYTIDGRKINNAAMYKWAKGVDVKPFKIQFEEEKKKPLSNNIDRERMYTFLHTNIPQKLDDLSSISILNILVDILMASKKEVINDELKFVIPMLNHVCHYYISMNLDIPLASSILDKISEDFTSFILHKKSTVTMAKDIKTWNKSKTIVQSQVQSHFINDKDLEDLDNDLDIH